MKKKPDGPLSKIQNFLQTDLWDFEPASLTKTRAAGLKFLRVCALVFTGFKEDKCPHHAAALTFTFVMALIPSLVIALSVAKAFKMEGLSETIIKAIGAPPAIEQPYDPALTENAVEPKKTEPLTENTEGTEDAFASKKPDSEKGLIGAYLADAVQKMPEEGKEVVVRILKTVEGASAGAMGGFSLVLFLYIMIKMLSQIEETFNSVWRVKTSRSMMDKVRNYVFVLVFAPVLVILATSVEPTILAVTAKLELALGPLSRLLSLMLPALVMSMGFCIFYIFLPNTKVTFSSAFTGAIISSILVVLLQAAMIRLGFGVSKYNKIYGALAAIPIFLFWVQVSWMILLMGAEVAFSVQNAGTYARERLAVNPSTRSRLCLAVALMKRITEKFESPDNPFDTVAYGTENRIPIRLINRVIHTLAQAGLVAESAEHPGCYTLLRDPRNITARQITDAILDDGASPKTLGLAADFPLFGKITDESFQTLEKQIVKSF